MNGAQLSPAVPKPDHVPEALVYDFDMRADPALCADPHTRVLDLIANQPPIFWTPRNGGHWMFISHEANFKAARDTETFSSSFLPPEQMAAMKAMLPPDIGHIPTAVPINLDPPEHTKYRLPLQGAFSPKAMEAMKSDIRALAASLIEKMKPAGKCEFMDAVAEPMPVQVFLKMLGLPLERMDEYRALVEEHLLLTTSHDMAKTIANVQKTARSMHDVFEARKKEPKDDLISMLWAMKVDGRETTMDDMDNYGVLLFIAGLDTVMQGIGFAARHLATDPALQKRLRENPGQISEAVEEVLRRYSFTVPPRRVAKDTVFEGIEMKANDRIMLFLPAADLDPKEFPEPTKVDLDREKKVHIAFNAGPHRCLGSHLARVELNILYEEMLSRMPEFRLDPEKPPKFHGGNVIGVNELHLVWDV